MAPLQDDPAKQGREASGEQHVPQCTRLFAFPESRGSRRYGCPLIPEIWLTVWLYGQELGKNMIGRLVTRRSEEEVCGWSSLSGNRV